MKTWDELKAWQQELVMICLEDAEKHYNEIADREEAGSYSKIAKRHRIAAEAFRAAALKLER